jgi:hypothetical protein
MLFRLMRIVPLQKLVVHFDDALIPFPLNSDAWSLSAEATHDGRATLKVVELRSTLRT